MKTLNEKNFDQLIEIKAKKIHRLNFLIKTTLQFCAILSQLDDHKKSLEISTKLTKKIKLMLVECFDYVREHLDRANISNSENSLNPPSVRKNNSLSKENIPTNLSCMKYNTQFSKNIIEYAYPILKNLCCYDCDSTNQNLEEIKKKIFLWKNNDNKNKLNSVKTEESNNEKRSLIGLRNNNNWINNFNIGSVMHMQPLSYNEFESIPDIFYEISEANLLEKVKYKFFKFNLYHNLKLR